MINKQRFSLKEFISTIEEKDMQIEDYKIRAWKKGTVNYKAVREAFLKAEPWKLGPNDK